MKSAHKSHLSLALALFLGCSTFAFGQAISGDLVGTIQDPSGAGVPNAAVEVTNDGTNIKNSAAANNSGEYRFSNLPPGMYTLTASGTGFGTSTLKRVTVSLNTTSTATAQLDTTTAQIQSTYTTRQVQDLPVTAIGMGVLNLSLLQAGVATTGGLGMGRGPSVGGQRPRNNNFT